MKEKFKVWMHIERIFGEDLDEEYEDMDEYVLPMPLGEFNSLKEAEEFMEHLNNQYYGE